MFIHVFHSAQLASSAQNESAYNNIRGYIFFLRVYIYTYIYTHNRVHYTPIPLSLLQHVHRACHFRTSEHGPVSHWTCFSLDLARLAKQSVQRHREMP